MIRLLFDDFDFPINAIVFVEPRASAFRSLFDIDLEAKNTVKAPACTTFSQKDVGLVLFQISQPNIEDCD